MDFLLFAFIYLHKWQTCKQTNTMMQNEINYKNTAHSRISCCYELLFIQVSFRLLLLIVSILWVVCFNVEFDVCIHFLRLIIIILCCILCFRERKRRNFQQARHFTRVSGWGLPSLTKNCVVHNIHPIRITLFYYYVHDLLLVVKPIFYPKTCSATALLSCLNLLLYTCIN